MLKGLYLIRLVITLPLNLFMFSDIALLLPESLRDDSIIYFLLLLAVDTVHIVLQYAFHDYA